MTCCKNYIQTRPKDALRRVEEGVLPENEGDKCLTLTAAVIQRFHMEAAMFGRYHEPTRTGVVISGVPTGGSYQTLEK